MSLKQERQPLFPSWSVSSYTCIVHSRQHSLRSSTVQFRQCYRIHAANGVSMLNWQFLVGYVVLAAPGYTIPACCDISDRGQTPYPDSPGKPLPEESKESDGLRRYSRNTCRTRRLMHLVARARKCTTVVGSAVLEERKPGVS